LKAEARARIEPQTVTAGHWKWKFIIPSLIGSLLFLVPVKFNGEVTIGVGILAALVKSLFNGYIPAFIIFILGLSAGISIITKVFKPRIIMNSKFLRGLFDTGLFGLAARVLGFAVGMMTILEAGPEFIWSRNTGGVVLYDL